MLVQSHVPVDQLHHLDCKKLAGQRHPVDRNQELEIEPPLLALYLKKTNERNFCGERMSCRIKWQRKSLNYLQQKGV